jgi:hypothetical protein
MHAVAQLARYNVDLYDTWCSMMVDGRCSPDDEIGNCDFEQFNVNSPIRYVDLFQSQASYPVEGLSLPDGSKVACSSNDKEYVAAELQCPTGFEQFYGEAVGYDSEQNCVFPCLSFLFTSEQIDLQFSVYVSMGFLAIITNLLLVVSYASAGKKARKNGSVLPFFVVQCAVLGLVFSMIDTLPTAALKLDLPCSDVCSDEFCHGDSFVCKLGQASEYLLLGVFCLLLRTLINLLGKTAYNMKPRQLKNMDTVFSVASITIVLFCVVMCFLAGADPAFMGSAAQSANELKERRQLIVARDAFNCGPRFSSAELEMFFLTLPFAVVCLALVGVTLAMTWNVFSLVRKNPGSSVSGTINKFGKIAGKLMLLALLVSLLWFIRVIVASMQAPIVDDFNDDAEKFRLCAIQDMTLLGSAGEMGIQIAACERSEEAGNQMTKSVALMAFVKNMQACIVGMVWGFSGATAATKSMVKSTARSMGLSSNSGVGSSSKRSASVSAVSSVQISSTGGD